MISNLFIFLAAIILVLKGATLATRYAGRLAESFQLSRYTVGFIVVAIISILPETFIGINAALEGIPSFGLGTLFGSNIADLTLIFALLVFLSRRNIKVESKMLKNHTVYPFLLVLPLLLGMDGYFSRLEGVTLIVAGGIFYYLAFKNGMGEKVANSNKERRKDLIFLIGSLALLLFGGHFVVESATTLAGYWGINPVLIGMLVVGLGTTIPEFTFSLNSIKHRNDSLAIGDMLGTVLADATIVVGILALVSPFSFPTKIIYVTGTLMVIAAFVLFHFMRTGRSITRREACMLFGFWILFVLVEFLVNR